MRLTLLLYNFLLFVVVLDAAASTIAAWYIFKLRQRFGWYLAFAFTGTAVEAAVMALTMGLGPAPQRIVGWIIAVRILTRLFKTTTMVLLSLYLLGYINGDKRNAQ